MQNFGHLSRVLFFVFLWITGTLLTFGQHVIDIKAELDDLSKSLNLRQTIHYHNQSKDTLNQIALVDWIHPYVSKKSPLARRFAESFKKNLHLATDRERGGTQINQVLDDRFIALSWSRDTLVDLVLVDLEKPLLPGEKTSVFLNYRVYLPHKKFTSKGYGPQGDYRLTDWYLTPALRGIGSWIAYPNLDIDRPSLPFSSISIDLGLPKDLHLSSNARWKVEKTDEKQQSMSLTLDYGKSIELVLTNEQECRLLTDQGSIQWESDFFHPSAPWQDESAQKVGSFIEQSLGVPSSGKIWVTKDQYQMDPLRGPNELPSIVQPYAPAFVWELQLLKTSIKNLIEQEFSWDERNDYWFVDGLAHYLMMRYVEIHYPDQKLLGKFSSIWGLRSYRVAQLNFNDQYELLYQIGARKNLDQPLLTPKDELLRYNLTIGQPYKAGRAIYGLSQFVGDKVFEQHITDWFKHQKGTYVNTEMLSAWMDQQSTLPTRWFFDRLNTDQDLDFKFLRPQRLSNDSLVLRMINRSASSAPALIEGYQNEIKTASWWTPPFAHEYDTIVARSTADQWVVNPRSTLSEINERNNWMRVKPSVFGNKPLSFRLLKDVENPEVHQFFFVPIAQFNAYDGFSPGLRLNNDPLLYRPFTFDIAPSYGLKSKSYVGYGLAKYTQYYDKASLYSTNLQVLASSYHFDDDFRYTTITPSFQMIWRPEDLRSNQRTYVSMRYIDVVQSNELSPDELNPNYQVSNLKIGQRNPGIVDYFAWELDNQYASNFVKTSFEIELRKLYDNNSQFNIRFFSGAFWRNTTSDDYFSFALDRPTDYLFEYDYLGRSEDTGLFSQQFVMADGGFKSKLSAPYANQWMTTINTSVNIWKWAEFYMDMGFVKNKGVQARMVHDSGIRLNLVTDYLEFYFPLYSNNGWEVTGSSYAEKIRFVVALNPRTLSGLFQRNYF